MRGQDDLKTASAPRLRLCQLQKLPSDATPAMPLVHPHLSNLATATPCVSAESGDHFSVLIPTEDGKTQRVDDASRLGVELVELILKKPDLRWRRVRAHDELRASHDVLSAISPANGQRSPAAAHDRTSGRLVQPHMIGRSPMPEETLFLTGREFLSNACQAACLRYTVHRISRGIGIDRSKVERPFRPVPETRKTFGAHVLRVTPQMYDSSPSVRRRRNSRSVMVGPGPSMTSDSRTTQARRAPPQSQSRIERQGETVTRRRLVQTGSGLLLESVPSPRQSVHCPIREASSRQQRGTRRASFRIRDQSVVRYNSRAITTV